MRHIIFISTLFLLCFSCQSNTVNEDAKNLASDICTCFKPLMEVSDQVESLLKNQQGEKAEALLDELQVAQESGEKCAASLSNKYGAETEVPKDQVKESMRVNCPKIYETLGEVLFK